MSRKASIECDTSGVPKNPGSWLCVDTEHRADAGESDRLAELILKAAKIWQEKTKPTPAKVESLKNVDLGDGPRQILEAIRKVGANRPSSLAEICGCSVPTAQRHLKRLALAGLIEKTGKTRGVRYALPKHKNDHG